MSQDGRYDKELFGLIIPTTMLSGNTHWFFLGDVSIGSSWEISTTNPCHLVYQQFSHIGLMGYGFS